MSKQQETYIPMEFVDSESESISFLPKPIAAILSKRRKIFDTKKLAILGWVLALILLGHSVLVWVWPKGPTDLQCTKQLSAWSPVFDVVEYEDVQFSNAFYQPSPYKGQPTPELEKKWLDLWMIGTIDVPLDKLPGRIPTSSRTHKNRKSKQI